MHKKSDKLYVVVFLIFAVLLVYGSWHFKRWFNWEYNYREETQQLIELLERRIEKLEKHIEDMNRINFIREKSKQ